MASQWTSPRFLRNCDKAETAKVISGRVATAAYMRLPIASQYSVLLMRTNLVLSMGESALLSTMPGVMGVTTGFASLRENWDKMASM